MIPPAEHQVDFLPAAVYLQLQIKLGLSSPIAVATFNPNVQIIQLDDLCVVYQNRGMPPRFAAYVSGLGDQYLEIHRTTARR